MEDMPGASMADRPVRSAALATLALKGLPCPILDWIEMAQVVRVTVDAPRSSLPPGHSATQIKSLLKSNVVEISVGLSVCFVMSRPPP
jgi:hypothetical protein